MHIQIQDETCQLFNKKKVQHRQHGAIDLLLLN